MIINCPHCGERYSSEFSYEGDATSTRPITNLPNDQQAWYDYVYARNNSVNNHQELWHHVYGCRQFIVVTRHLHSHEIVSTQTVNDFHANRKQQIAE